MVVARVRPVSIPVEVTNIEVAVRVAIMYEAPPVPPHLVHQSADSKLYRIRHLIQQMNLLIRLLS